MPHYCSAMVDLALIHSRIEDDSETEKTNDKNENCIVYICATMWHESELEMKKLLRSLYRYCLFKPDVYFLDIEKYFCTVYLSYERCIY